MVTRLGWQHGAPDLLTPQPSLADQEWQEVLQVGWGWAGVQGGGVGGGLASPVPGQGQRPSPLTIRSLPKPQTPGSCPALPARPAPPRPGGARETQSQAPPRQSAAEPLHPSASGCGRGTQLQSGSGQPSGAVSPQTVRNLPATQKPGLNPGSPRSLEKEMAAHSVLLPGECHRAGAWQVTQFDGVTKSGWCGPQPQRPSLCLGVPAGLRVGLCLPAWVGVQARGCVCAW